MSVITSPSLPPPSGSPKQNATPNRSGSWRNSSNAAPSTSAKSASRSGSSTASPSLSPSRSSSRLRGLLTQVSQDESSSTSPNRTTSTTTLPSIGGGPQPKRQHSSSQLLTSKTSSPITTKLSSPLMDVGGFLVTADALRTITNRKKNGSPFDGARYFPMIPPPKTNAPKRHLLCLDIDETLLHASFQASAFDAKIVLEAEGETAEVFIRFRPHVKEFLEVASQLFEIAIFTASQSTYADKVLKELDPTGVLLGTAAAPVLSPETPPSRVKQSLSGGATGAINRLYREHCAEVSGARVKDLSLLGRSLDTVILLDNSPVTYLFQPRNAIPIQSFFDDASDTEFLKLIPVLKKLATAESVYDVLDPYNASLISL